MKILFEKHLCPREFGSAVFNVPDLLKWAQKKGFHLPTLPPLDDYDFAQAEYVLSLIANFPHHNSTTDEAAAHVATKPALAQHPTAESAPVFLVGADAGEQWRVVFSQAIANGELVLFDRYSLLPVVAAGAPAAQVEAGTSPSDDDVDHNETLAALFDPLPVEALAKMFMIDLAQWKKWQDKAKANGLSDARQGTALFNPYKAGVWLVRKGVQNWDDAHLYRTLAKNLPARSLDDKHLLTGGID